MRTNWKFEFPIEDEINLEMPWGASIKLVECQQGQPTLWAEVETLNFKEIRHFRLFGTGQSIPETGPVPLFHVATFQMPPFVWHLYSLEEAPPVPPPAP